MRRKVPRAVEEKGGYWFIATLIDVRARLPARFTSNVRIQRATDKQIDAIKRVFPAPGFFGHKIEDGRETTWLRTVGGRIGRSLPRAKWRYFLLAYRGNGVEAYGVKKALLLAEPPCTCRIRITTTGAFGTGRMVGWGGEMYTHTEGSYGVSELPAPVIVTHKTFNQVRETYVELQKLGSQFPEIPRAVDMLNDLRMVPIRSDLYVLGLFAILELLLTHNPKDKENADSLNHQLSTKIPLLDRRLSEPINYSSFTSRGSVSPGKLWKTLYAYRSKIAHGARADFNGELKVLESAQCAREFLQLACQKLIRFAITEPQLLEDLKAV